MNDDLISRSALKKELSDKDYITYTHEYGDAIPVEWVMSAIDNAPTVERPTGEWKHNGFCVTTTQYKCSECGMHSLDRSNFCPNCGADMRGGRE